MSRLTVTLMIVSGIAIIGIILFVEVSKTASDVFQLSVTAQTSPKNTKIHTLQQLATIDRNSTILDNSTLDKIPVLKNAIDRAFSGFVPPPFQSSRTFTTQISQSDADSIIQLAGNKVNQIPETETNDINFGVNFTRYASEMEFKLNNFYYHTVIEKLVLSQDNQSNNSP